MKWFIANVTPTNIGILLVLAVIVWICWQWLNAWIDRGDHEWLLKNPLSPDEQESIDMYGAQCQRDLADLESGSKLS